MLGTISLITSLFFAVLYPLVFWISHKNPLKNNFHHFHTGLPAIIAVITTVFIYKGPYSDLIKILSIVWALSLLITVFIYWKKETPSVLTLTAVSLIGLSVTYLIHVQLISFYFINFLISTLGACIFVSSLFAMNLGHWYLNVHGLPIEHLKKTNKVLAGFLLIRLMWDVIYLSKVSLYIQGELVKLSEFSFRIDGIFIYVAILFGIIFPLVAFFMVREILRLKNTQAATGILYVILCSIILADIVYKYYLIRYGIAM